MCQTLLGMPFKADNLWTINPHCALQCRHCAFPEDDGKLSSQQAKF